ncbi:TauD/TfdA dioxygenase family protein [Paraburkholderia sp. RL17-347-BIC-D]|uniref:TauD/TfdA dioxygenase family protein n=1 Tax=Paraburkholderia sp. RL17-347-BIC-D TaxID=3031632 RepID=UPI0038B6D069
MPLIVRPVFDDFEFAAEIGGVTLADALSVADRQRIREAFVRYPVLIFCDQTLSNEQHLAFAQIFGDLETFSIARAEDKRPLPPGLADVSNLEADGSLWPADSRRRNYMLKGNAMWHTDSTYKPLPASVSALYARAVPPTGGQLHFADMRAAYDALPASTKHLLHKRVGLHSIMTSRAKAGFADFSDEEKTTFKSQPQALVRHLKDSGRRCLFLASHLGEVVGMPKEESAALITELTAHATQRQFQYSHRWRERDLVIWDNRCTMHRLAFWDDLQFPFDIRRATISDVAPTCEQEDIATA